jgi:hypothetical protein
VCPESIRLEVLLLEDTFHAPCDITQWYRDTEYSLMLLVAGLGCLLKKARFRGRS